MLIRVNTDVLAPNYRVGDVCEIATDIDAESDDDVVVRDAAGVLAIVLAPAAIIPGTAVVGVVVERRRRLRPLFGIQQ